MTYSKPCLSVPEQRQLLESRGMEFPDAAKAEECLRRIGYYRLSAYWHPFRVLGTNEDGSHFLENRFKQGTAFKHATDLYAFDKGLRLIVLDAIERMEVSVRTEFALAMGQISADAHRSQSNFDGKFSRVRPPHTRSRYQNWLAKLDEKAQDSKEEFAQHSRTKYAGDTMPVWIAVGFWILAHCRSRYPK